MEWQFRSVFDPAALDPKVMLKTLAHRALNVVAEDPQYLNFIRLIFGESGRFPQLAQAFVSKIEQTGFKALTQYLATNPHLELKDPEVTARIFIGAIVHLVHFVIVQEMLQGKTIVPPRERSFCGWSSGAHYPESEVLGKLPGTPHEGEGCPVIGMGQFPIVEELYTILG